MNSLLDKKNSQLSQLWGDNEPDSFWGKYGLTSGEYDKINTARMLEFINVYPVMDCEVDSNNYGEFLFISCAVDMWTNAGEHYIEMIQFWGYGYHYDRDVMYTDWRMNFGNGFLLKNKSAIPLDDVLAMIESRRVELGITNHAPEGKSGNTFEMLADLSDDDAASIMFDDMEY